MFGNCVMMPASFTQAARLSHGTSRRREGLDGAKGKSLARCARVKAPGSGAQQEVIIRSVQREGTP